jgi:type I restriction enzyme S subunit
MKETQQYTMGELFTLEYGKPVPDKESIDGSVPVYGTNGQIGTSHLKPLCNHPSVILGRKGAYRGVHYSNRPFSVIDTAFYIELITDKVDIKWLYYKLLTYDINSMDSGSAIPSTDRYQIYSLQIEVPSISTQRRIVDVLDSITTKIELNRQINDNLEQQAQALYKSWFIDFEPFKDGKFEESEIGLIPEGWHVGKAEDFYEINIGKTPPRKEHEWFTLDKSQNIWVSISDLGSDGRFLFDSSEYLTDKAIQKHNIVLVPEDTVLLSFKLTIGRVGIAGTQLTTNEAIARFITNSVNREYTYFLLKNFNYSKLGSTSSIATAVNSKIIKAMMVLMPSNECLLNFKKLVGPIIDGIKKNEEEILRLTALRDILLPKLMSGELKINEIDC